MRINVYKERNQNKTEFSLLLQLVMGDCLRSSCRCIVGVAHLRVSSQRRVRRGEPRPPLRVRHLHPLRDRVRLPSRAARRSLPADGRRADRRRPPLATQLMWVTERRGRQHAGAFWGALGTFWGAWGTFWGGFVTIWGAFLASGMRQGLQRYRYWYRRYWN